MPRPDYFSAEDLQSGLRQKAVRGFAFVAGGQGMGVALKLASLPVLARLLDPADFGLMGIALSIGGFSAMLTDAGMSMATIRTPEINRQQVSNLFWLTAAFGTIVACVFAALAPSVAWLYGDDRLRAILLVYAPTFVISALTIQPQALMRRGMQNRELAGITLASLVAGFAVAIWLAWLYRNYWALVAMHFVQPTVRLAGTWMLCNWRPTAPRREPGTLGMLRFGSTLMASSFVNTTALNLDKPLIGATAGLTAAGLYDRAFAVHMISIRQVCEPLGSVLVPALSRTVDTAERYRQLYFKAVAGLFTFTAPIVVTLLVAADAFVLCVLGPKYTDAVPLVQVLTASVLVMPLGYAAGWLFTSQGRAGELLQWLSLDAVLRIVFVGIGAQWGAIGVAVASTARVFVLLPELFRRTGRSGPISAQTQWSLVGMKLVGVGVGVPFAYLVRSQLPDSLGPLLTLLVVGLTAGVTSVAALSGFASYRNACALAIKTLLHRDGARTAAQEA